MASPELIIPFWIVFNRQNPDFSRKVQPTCLDKILGLSLGEGHKWKGLSCCSKWWWSLFVTSLFNHLSLKWNVVSPNIHSWDLWLIFMFKEKKKGSFIFSQHGKTVLMIFILKNVYFSLSGKAHYYYSWKQ